MKYASMLNQIHNPGILRAPRNEEGADEGSDLYSKPESSVEHGDMGTNSGDKGSKEVTTEKSGTEDFSSQNRNEKSELGDKAERILEEGEKDEFQTEEKSDVIEKEKPTQLLKLDPETIALLRAQSPQVKEAIKEQELTPAQIKELLNPVEINDAVLKMFDPAATAQERASALQLYTNMVVKNTSSINRLMLERKEREFNGIMTPLVQARQQAELAQHKSDFYTKNKDLTKFEKIVNVAATEIAQDKASLSWSKEKVFSEVAKRARATIESFGIKLDSAANLKSEDKGDGSVPRPNKLSDSGRSGGDNSQGKGQQNNPDADIYDKAPLGKR